jgi:hypothetical protein
MWDWLEEQYLAPDSRLGTNGAPPLAASDASALLRLIERGVAARGQTAADDASAAQFARETAAATVARAVKPPYGRDEGALTRVPEDLVRSMLRGPYSGYPAWPSPANPASPFPPPPSPAAPINAPIDDDHAREAQAAREAAARTVASAARHPYGRVFESVMPINTPAETEGPRQAQLAREAWARWLASQGRNVKPPPPPTEAPAKISEIADVQAAYEAGTRKIKNAAKPERGHRKEGEVTQWIVDHWPEALLFAITAPAGGAAAGTELAAHTLLNLLKSTRPAE